MSIVPYRTRYTPLTGSSNVWPYGVQTASSRYRSALSIYNVTRRALRGGTITPNEAYQIARAAAPYIRSAATNLYRRTQHYLNQPVPRVNIPATPPAAAAPPPAPAAPMAQRMDTGVAIARKIAGREFGSNGPLVEPPESSTVVLRYNTVSNNTAAAINDVSNLDITWPISPTIGFQSTGAIAINNQHPAADKYVRVYRQFRVDAWKVSISITRIATTNNETHFVLLLPRAGVLGSLAALPLWAASLGAYAGQTYSTRYERCKADKDFKIGPIISFPRCPDLAAPGARFQQGWASDWITPGQLADESELTEDVLASRNGDISVNPSTNALTITAATFGNGLGLRLINFGDNLAGTTAADFRIEVTQHAQFTFFDKSTRGGAGTSFVDD